MKNKRIFALILFFIVLFFTGCQNNNKIKIFDSSEIPNDKKGYISLSVYGTDGEEIIREVYVPLDYKKKITVKDLSRDICRELGIPFVVTSDGYVQGINNLFEKDRGPESGWLYCVNGEFQKVGCGDYILKDGDYVEWRYTYDLGKDLDAYKLD